MTPPASADSASISDPAAAERARVARRAAPGRRITAAVAERAEQPQPRDRAAARQAPDEQRQARSRRRPSAPCSARRPPPRGTSRRPGSRPRCAPGRPAPPAAAPARRARRVSGMRRITATTQSSAPQANLRGVTTAERGAFVAGDERRVACRPGPAAPRGCRARRSRRASRTTIWSASRTVESRWAMTSVVRPSASRSSASPTARSVGDVERAGRLVEHEHGRVAQDRAGDRDALLLAAGEAEAALADDGVVALGERRDRLVDLGGAGRLLDLLVGRVRPREAQVLAHAGVEEVGLLGDDADGRRPASPA